MQFFIKFRQYLRINQKLFLKQNLAIVAGSGYNDDSRSFLSTQSEIKRIAAKDVTNIKINTLRG